MIEFRSRGPDVDSNAVTAFAAKHGLTLPNDYFEFLVESNGGRPSPRAFGVSTVRHFFSLNSDEPSTDLERTLTLFGWQFPEGSLPIGKDSFGNFLLLGVDGQVLFWDHEEEDGDVQVVAPSFSDFLASLKDDEDEV